MAESRAHSKASPADRIHELKIDRDAPRAAAHRGLWLGLAPGVTAAVAVACWFSAGTAGGAVVTL